VVVEVVTQITQIVDADQEEEVILVVLEEEVVTRLLEVQEMFHQFHPHKVMMAVMQLFI
jgi:hypothetical protein